MKRPPATTALLMILLLTHIGCAIKHSVVHHVRDAPVRGESTPEEEDGLDPDDETRSRPSARHSMALLLAASYWKDAQDLAPDPIDFVTEQSGSFKTDGYGFEFSYDYRRGRVGRAVHLIGAEFAGYGHANEKHYVGYNAITGESSRITLEANWGYIAGTTQFVWREGRRLEPYAGAGIGLYLLRMKESLEDFGAADRSESDATFGGLVCAGLRIPYKTTRFLFRLEGKIHAVEYDGLGGAFADQRARGPMYTLGFGGEWR